eukprot:15366197-Ditylum_brightwellii.AAC.1
MAADDVLNGTSATSNQEVAGSIMVIANNVISPVGVFTAYRPIWSTHTVFQAGRFYMFYYELYSP